MVRGPHDSHGDPGCAWDLSSPRPRSLALQQCFLWAASGPWRREDTSGRHWGKRVWLPGLRSLWGPRPGALMAEGSCVCPRDAELCRDRTASHFHPPSARCFQKPLNTLSPRGCRAGEGRRQPLRGLWGALTALCPVHLTRKEGVALPFPEGNGAIPKAMCVPSTPAFPSWGHHATLLG